jgi:sec-independent protein translocase protein TatB
MHFMDYSFIFLLALVLFGPKKLPEIGRQLGKLLGEFRRASNDFKFQIQEEMRNLDEEERRKKLAAQQAALAATPVAAEPAAAASPADTLPEISTVPTTPMILPPSMGAQVTADRPFATPSEPVSESAASPQETNGIENQPPAPTEFSEAPLIEAVPPPSEVVPLPGVDSVATEVRHG